MGILDWIVDNKKTIEDVGDKAKKYAKEEMTKHWEFDRVGKVLGLKKGGKVKMKQKQKQKQTVNIKNIITLTKPSKRKSKSRKTPQPQPQQAPQPIRYFQSTYERLFVPQPTNFRNLTIGNPNSTSDNIAPILNKVEEIKNGKIKQEVNKTIDTNEVNRINQTLGTNMDNIYSTPKNLEHEFKESLKEEESEHIYTKPEYEEKKQPPIYIEEDEKFNYENLNKLDQKELKIIAKEIKAPYSGNKGIFKKSKIIENILEKRSRR